MKLRFCLLLLAAQVVYAADGFTPEETKTVDQIKTAIDSTCRKGIAEYQNKMNDQAPPVARWLTSLIATSDYCTCASRKFGEDITPEDLRTGSMQGLTAVAERSGTECLLPGFKSTFPSFCADLVQEIDSHGGRSPPSADFCGCIQKEVDGITVDNFKEFVRDSRKDRDEYKQTGKVPDSSHSIVAAMFRCGMKPAGS